MFKFLKIIGICVILLNASMGIGWTQDISIQSEVNTNKIALDSSLQLTLTVHGTQNVAPFQSPDIEGFDVKYLGPSTHLSFVNGEYTRSKALTFSLFPLKTGIFQIPAFNMTISGKTYSTQPIKIEVVSSSETLMPAEQKQAKHLQDKVFLVLKTSKQQVYLNERLPVKVLLFVTDLALRDVHYPEIDSIGFSFEGYEKPKQYQQVVGGIRYDIVEFDTVMYPTRTGTMHLGPAKVECNVLAKSPGRSRMGGMDGFLDDAFFDSFFERGEKRTLVLKSEDVAINVLELPEEGKPSDFSGAVGEFNFNVSVSPPEVKEGDPITLRMTVIGDGNLKAVQLPSFDGKGQFKFYDPQVYEKDNIKKFEQVIIPKSDQINEIPAIEFSYFDVELKKYRTIKRGPFPIVVTKLDQEDSFKIVGLDGQINIVEPETLGQDIVFIKDNPGTLRPVGYHIYKTLVFYCLIVLAIGLWLTIYIVYERARRLQTDIVYARRLQAPKHAKKGLLHAKRLLATGKKEEFYNSIFKTLQHYFGNKLHLSSGAITFETVQSHLVSKHQDGKVIQDIKIIFEQCDNIRYASGLIDGKNMKDSYQRVEHIIDHLERHLK